MTRFQSGLEAGNAKTSMNGSSSPTTAFAGSASAVPEPIHDVENAPQQSAEPMPSAEIAAHPLSSPPVPSFLSLLARRNASVHEAAAYSPQGGQVEHEEFDEEETDMPSCSEHIDTAGHQETEERVYNRQGESSNGGGEVFGDTVREADVEHVLRES